MPVRVKESNDIKGLSKHLCSCSLFKIISKMKQKTT